MTATMEDVEREHSALFDILVTRYLQLSEEQFKALQPQGNSESACIARFGWITIMIGMRVKRDAQMNETAKHLST